MTQAIHDKWIEIDVEAVRNNLTAVKSLIGQKVRLIAVVKANAYGHGAAEIARILNHDGVDFFAVSYLYEALELREAGINSDILLFAPVVGEKQVTQAIENNITLTVASSYDSELINKISTGMNHSVKIHIKVDTGLGRFGLKAEEIIEVFETLNLNSKIYIEGIYTHMARGAAHNPHYTRQQFQEFMDVISQLSNKGYNIPIKHCANSAVLLKYPEMHLDAVRVGTLLSGQYPVGISDHPAPLTDPYKFKSRVISVHTLNAGSFLGYNSTYRLKRDAQIAVIPVGFNDGLAVGVANKPAGFVDMLKIIAKTILNYLNVSRFNLSVIINGKQYPIRGKVFMQMALAEIPLSDTISPGDEVELPVRKTLVPRDLEHIYKDNAAVIRKEYRSSNILGET